MALKDWKKTRTKPFWIDFEKKDKSSYKGDMNIMITKQYSKDIYKNPIKQKFIWTVSIGNHLGYQHKYFKTEKQALAYAKDYMRKH